MPVAGTSSLARASSSLARASTRSRQGRVSTLKSSRVDHQISIGRAVLSLLRWRLALVTLSAGLLLTVAYMAVTVLVIIPQGLLVRTCGEELASWLWISFVASPLLWWRCGLLALAPLAGDVPVTRLAVANEFLALLLTEVGDYVELLIYKPPQHGHDDTAHSVIYQIYAGMFSCANIAAMVSYVFIMCLSDAALMQRYMWSFLSIWLWASCLMNLGVFIHHSVMCQHPATNLAWVPAMLPVIYLSSNSGVRQRCQALLRRMIERLERDSERRAAAGIAGLVGTCSVREVRTQANSRFRSVLLSDVSLEDLRDNKPNPALHGKSHPEVLHQCDAFVSHSWHDDAEAKWEALQRWRDDFRQAYGREPRVWFDKYCIDQNNIEEDLRCLPIYLSGCRRLLVLIGPTYLTRLWCLMELFTFFYIGRNPENIDVDLLARDGCGAADRALVEEAFDSFASEQCECSLAGDKERILSIVQAAFGDLSNFNMAVRQIFYRTGLQRVVTSTRSFMERWSTSLGEDDNSVDADTSDSDSNSSSSPLSTIQSSPQSSDTCSSTRSSGAFCANIRRA